MISLACPWAHRTLIFRALKGLEDQLGEAEIRRLYGNQWRKSALIEDAYEAEKFFPSLGENGKWCWFTAAPIKTPEGEVVGAIETIWDKTEERLAEIEVAVVAVWALASKPAIGASFAISSRASVWGWKIVSRPGSVCFRAASGRRLRW